MRETITFPRPHHRSRTSVLMIALLGAVLLVLGLPGPIAEQGGAGPSQSGRMAVVEQPGR
jgi:hypothetical protein